MDRRAVLRHRYPPLPEPRLSRRDTALLVIDMQYLDAHPEHGICAAFKRRGEAEALQEYTDRLPVIVENTRRLLAGFREHEMEVIFTRIESLTRDGRDRSLEHKRVGLHCPPGAKEGQILEELAPRADEIVLTKTCGSVFNGTMIDYVLWNIGITTLVVTGVVTSGCVEGAVRDAADRSYTVVVVEDACASWDNAYHADAIARMDDVFGKVRSTQAVLELLTRL